MAAEALSPVLDLSVTAHGVQNLPMKEGYRDARRLWRPCTGPWDFRWSFSDDRLYPSRMYRRFRMGLTILIAAAFLLASWGAAPLASTAPLCMGCAGDMPDMPGMDHNGSNKSGADCMVKAGCYATCAKLPTRDVSSSSPAFVRLAFSLQLADQFEAITPSPEPSPPKTIA